MYIYEIKLREAYKKYNKDIGKLREAAIAKLQQIFIDANRLRSRELVAHIASNKGNNKYWIDSEYCTEIIDILGENNAEYGRQLFDDANRLCVIMGILMPVLVEPNTATYEDMNRIFLVIMGFAKTEDNAWMLNYKKGDGWFSWIKHLCYGISTAVSSLRDIWCYLGLESDEAKRLQAVIESSDFSSFIIDYPARVINYLSAEEKADGRSQLANLSQFTKQLILDWYLNVQAVDAGSVINLSLFGPLVTNKTVRKFKAKRQGSARGFVLDGTAITDKTIGHLLNNESVLYFLSMRGCDNIKLDFSDKISCRHLGYLDVSYCNKIIMYRFMKFPFEYASIDTIIAQNSPGSYQTHFLRSLFDNLRSEFPNYGASVNCYLDLDLQQPLVVKLIRKLLLARVFEKHCHIGGLTMILGKYDYLLDLVTSVWCEKIQAKGVNYESYLAAILRLFDKSSMVNSLLHCKLTTDIASYLAIINNRQMQGKIAGICFDAIPDLSILCKLIQSAKQISYIDIETKPARVRVCLPRELSINCYRHSLSDNVYVIDASEVRNIDIIGKTYSSLVAAIGSSNILQDKVTKREIAGKTCYVVTDDGLIRALLLRADLRLKDLELPLKLVRSPWSTEFEIELTDDILTICPDSLIACCAKNVAAKERLTLNLSRLTSNLCDQGWRSLIEVMRDYGGSLKIRSLGASMSRRLAETHLSMVLETCASVTFGEVIDGAITELLLVVKRCYIDVKQYIKLLIDRIPSLNNKSWRRWQKIPQSEVSLIFGLYALDDGISGLGYGFLKYMCNGRYSDSDRFGYIVNCLHEFCYSECQANRKESVLLAVELLNKSSLSSKWRPCETAIFAAYAEHWLHMDVNMQSEAKAVMRFIKPEWAFDNMSLAGMFFEIANVLALNYSYRSFYNFFAAGFALHDSLDWGYGLSNRYSSRNAYPYTIDLEENINDDSDDDCDPLIYNYPHRDYFIAGSKYLTLQSLLKHIVVMWKYGCDGLRDYVVYLLKSSSSVVSTEDLIGLCLHVAPYMRLHDTYLYSEDGRGDISSKDVFTFLNRNIGPHYYEYFAKYFLGLMLAELSSDDLAVFRPLFDVIDPVGPTEKFYKILVMKNLYPKDDKVVAAYNNYILSVGQHNENAKYMSPLFNQYSLFNSQSERKKIQVMGEMSLLKASCLTMLNDIKFCRVAEVAGGEGSPKPHGDFVRATIR